MDSWILHVFVLFLLVSSNIMKSDIDAVFNDLSNINVAEYSHYADKLTSLRDKYTHAINRFRCPKGWRRFGGSCYHLSNVTSKSVEVNDTCNRLYLNNSQLMQIRHPVEIYYASRILIQNDLSGLIFQISPHLFKGKKIFDEIFLNDTISWQSAEDKFQQARRNLQYDNEIDSFSDTQTTPVTENKKDYSEKNTIDSSIIRNDFERLDDIRHVCDKIVWNVLNNSEDVFVLTRYSMLDQMICSINNIEIDRSYEYLCQYVLDFCFANTICGSHGKCVNNLMNLKCSCYLYMDGARCQQISMVFVQLCICSIVIFLLWLLTTSPLQNIQRRLIQKFDDYFKSQPTTPDLEGNNKKNNVDDNAEQKSIADSETQTPNKISLFWRRISMGIIFCLLCIIPSLYQWNSLQFNNNDLLKLDLLINNTVQSIKQCDDTPIFSIHNLIFVPTSLTLCLIFSFFTKRPKQCISVCNGRPGCLSPMNPFITTNRYETAALCGLVVFDLLLALEHFFIDISQLWKQGVLIQIFDRTIIPLIYSLRYYPLFLSLQQRNRYVRCLAFIYILLNFGYIIVRRSLCMDFLSLSKSFSAIDEAKHRLKHRNWIILYGLIKSTPQFILLSYIIVELFLRVFYNSSSQSDTTNSNNTELSSDTTSSNNTELSSDTIDESVTPSSNDISNDSSKIENYLSNFGHTLEIFLVKSIDRIKISVIPQWQYIDNWSFRTEILISAIFTMIIFTKRILKEMMKYKKHTNDLKNNNYEEIPRLDQSEQESIGHKSIEYLSSVFLNIVGGYFIWFHLILFVGLTFRLISSLFRPSTYQEYIRGFSSSLFLFIAPICVVYRFKKSITEWLCIFIPSHQPDENKNNRANKKIHAILIYFTFIISCHVVVVSSILRLSKSVIFNILLMPRVDSSYFSQKWQKNDSQYMAYVAYLYMEKAYRQSTEPTSISIPVVKQFKECGIQVSIDDPRDFEDIDWEDASDRMSDITTRFENESGEEDSSRSSTPIQVDVLDDSVSTTSRTSSKIQRREIITVPEDQTLFSSQILQGVDTNDQQLLHHHHQHNVQVKTNQGSSHHEKQPLLTSIPVDSDNEDDPPALPPKTYKKVISKECDNRFPSDEV